MPGAKGNGRAIVAALDLEPTQLRIADVMTIGPTRGLASRASGFGGARPTSAPEIARIVNESYLMEEWDADTTGRIVSLRRGG